MRADATVVLVEGESDRRALAALARRLGHDLAASGADVVPMGGITNLRHHLAELDAREAPPRVLGLFDVGEQGHVARMLTAAGRGPADSVDDLEALGFFACTLDLEDELIRAVGTAGVERVLDVEGELASFRRFQDQPAQRGGTLHAQLHRFLGTRAGRKVRYGTLLVDALDLDRVPKALDLALARATRGPDARR